MSSRVTHTPSHTPSALITRRNQHTTPSTRHPARNHRHHSQELHQHPTSQQQQQHRHIWHLQSPGANRVLASFPSFHQQQRAEERMKSAAVAVIGALCCGASSVGAFVVPVGRPSGSSSSVVASSAARRSFVRRASGPSMSSVAAPPTTSVAPTQEPERRANVQVRDGKRAQQRSKVESCCCVCWLLRWVGIVLCVFCVCLRPKKHVCVHQRKASLMSILSF